MRAVFGAGVVSVLSKLKSRMHTGGPMWVEQYAAAEHKVHATQLALKVL